jgi:molybdate transport repressor ModE-like protein
MNWDDLRVFLAVARHGSLVAAARRLSMDHTTVARRLSALEAAMAVRLVDRSPAGAALTDAGTALLDHTERIEAEVLAAAEWLGAADQQLSGTVRLATPEAFERLPRPSPRHPGGTGAAAAGGQSIEARG